MLQAGQHAELDAVLEATAPADAPVYVLFPGAGAVSVSEVACAAEHRRCLEETPLPAIGPHPGLPAAANAEEPSQGRGVPDHDCYLTQALERFPDHHGAAGAVAPGTRDLLGPGSAAERSPARHSHPAYWLIALDGTWQQANEMLQVLLLFRLEQLPHHNMFCCLAQGLLKPKQRLHFLPRKC